MLLANCLWCFSILISINAQIIVTTPNGKLRGRQEYSQRGISFYAFQQIPYAKPPVGYLRFKEPVPAEPWSGILDATKNDKLCFQQKNLYNVPDLSVLETEDCLYINVYTPVYPSKNVSVPVIFYVYGGGFIDGGANFDFHGPHYLMEHNIIVVTINYRVGLFGFLATGDTVIPGNFGLKDQLLGLHWVQKNIEFFGGDKTKVTIMGESAGGASVTYQLMSNKSKGLYRAAIAQSGSILCPWTYQRNYRSIAYSLASLVEPGFNSNASSKQLLQLLQSKSAKHLNEMSKAMLSRTKLHSVILGFQYAPVIEPEHKNAFITQRMYEALVNGQLQRVPLIIGICSEELISLLLGKGRRQWIGTKAAKFNNNLSLLINENMYLTEESRLKIAGKEIRKLYADGLLQNNIGNVVEYFSDMAFGRSIIHHAIKQSQFSDVYFYQFSYYGTIPGVRPYIEGAYRVAHADDNRYLWVSMNNSNLNTYPKGDVLTSERFITLFTNFAKTMNPMSNNTDLLGVTSWPKVTPTDFQYLDINETLTVRRDLKKKVYADWVDHYETIAVKPYDTF